LFVSPYDRSDDEPPSHLPLSAPVGAQCLAPTGGEGCRSNPIEAPGPPGQPQTVDGAAPECAIPAPECATCAPECTLPEHPSAHQDTVSPPDRS
jgi:hypothetical protein